MSKRAVFLDRDGTVIEHYDYLTDPSQVKLLARTAPALKMLKNRGYLLIIVTNQSAVARGLLTEKKLSQIHDHLQAMLGREGVFLDRIYYCPYHPEATVDKYRRDSELRKPKPGMLYWAAQELGIDLSESWMIGDDDRDIEAGRAAGCRTIMLESRGSSLVRRGQTDPDFTAINLQEAANLIIRYSERKKPPATVVHQTTADVAEYFDANQPLAGTAAIHDNPPPVAAERTALDAPPVAIEESTREAPPPAKREFYQTGSAPVEEVPSETEIVREPPETVVGIPEIPDVSEDEPEPDADDKDTNQANRDDLETKTKTGDESITVLLKQILRELKKLNRTEQTPADFSVGKLFAGITQMLVILCIIMMFRAITGPSIDHEAAQRFLLLALVFQTLTLTLLIGHKN